MERIKSFCVDHTKLKKGVYISRMDDTLITYDIRMCEPNVENMPIRLYILDLWDV